MANRVVMLLGGKKGYQALVSLSSTHKKLVKTVIVGSDPNVEDDLSSDIIKYCLKNKIVVVGRHETNSYLDGFIGYKIAIGWRWMLRESSRLIVIHDSLLPRYRGFAPLVNCLINGEELIGATAFFGTSEYDAGPVISQRSINIRYPIKISEAINRMCDLYSHLLQEILDKISNDESISSVKQNESLASYSLWRDESDYFIDWNRSAIEIARFIDAVGPPYKGAKCYANSELTIINSAVPLRDKLICDRDNAIGKVIYFDKEYPVVVCSEGLLKITDIISANFMQFLPVKQFKIRFSSDYAHKGSI